MAKVRSLDTLEKQQRKIDKRRAGKRRGPGRKLFIFFLVLVFVGIITTLSLTVFFFIEKIEVIGNEKYAAEEILSLVSVKTGENMFRIETESSEERILELLPYIDEVNIRRKMPDTLLIEVEEAKPAYKIDTDNYTGILLDKKSKVLEKVENCADYDLIEVVGLKTAEYRVGETLEAQNQGNTEIVNHIISYISENDIENIKYIDIKDKYDIRLNYNRKIRILLGSEQDLEEKIILLRGVLERIHDNETGEIDIRSTSTAYFKPTPKAN